MQSSFTGTAGPTSVEPRVFVDLVDSMTPTKSARLQQLACSSLDCGQADGLCGRQRFVEKRSGAVRVPGLVAREEHPRPIDPRARDTYDRARCLLHLEGLLEACIRFVEA